MLIHLKINTEQGRVIRLYKIRKHRYSQSCNIIWCMSMCAAGMCLKLSSPCLILHHFAALPIVNQRNTWMAHSLSYRLLSLCFWSCPIWTQPDLPPRGKWWRVWLLHMATVWSLIRLWDLCFSLLQFSWMCSPHAFVSLRFECACAKKLWANYFFV